MKPYEIEDFFDPNIIEEQHEKFPDLFVFARQCLDSATRMVSLFNSDKDKQTTASVMFARCIAHFHGAIILAERGLSIESMTLSRAIYETTFVLGALAENEITAEDLLDSDYGNRKKMGSALLKITTEKINSDHHNKLGKFIEENNEKKPIGFALLAQKAKMQAVYDGYYRHLSHFAAHSSLTAASGYFTEQTNGQDQVIFRPLIEDTPKAILFACSAIILACASFEKIAQTNLEINAEIITRLDQEQALHVKYNPLR